MASLFLSALHKQALASVVMKLFTVLLFHLRLLRYAGILATERLGMALAWPLIQCQLLVSTAWGALYYREQTGPRHIGGILAATLLVIIGAVMLTLGKRGGAN